MFVKICGITTPADAVAAVEAGADAVGMIFAPSRRMIGIDEAAAIVAAVDGRALTVGVFRDDLASEVIEAVRRAGLDVAQLHGSETPATTREVSQHVPFVFRAMAAGDPQLSSVDEHDADVVLLDAPTPGGGVPFDWTLVGDLASRHRLVLAGGLRPDNVAEAIETVCPWGVDVASGVESTPGRKDHDAVRRFVAAARTAQTARSVVHPPLAIDSHDRNPA